MSHALMSCNSGGAGFCFSLKCCLSPVCPTSYHLEGLFLFASERIDSVLKRSTFKVNLFVCHSRRVCLLNQHEEQCRKGFIHTLVAWKADWLSLDSLIISLVRFPCTFTGWLHLKWIWRLGEEPVFYPFKASLKTQINFNLNIIHWLILKRFLGGCLLQHTHIKTKHEAVDHIENVFGAFHVTVKAHNWGVVGGCQSVALQLLRCC